MTGDEFFCYECRDELHDSCVGVPCMCDCPDPKYVRFEAEETVEALEL